MKSIIGKCRLAASSAGRGLALTWALGFAEIALAQSETLRVATYNIEADINGVTAPRSGLYQVLEGIGEQLIAGNAQPLDILALEETTSNSVTVAPIVSNLNAFYNGSAIYAQSPVQGGQAGGNTSGNGPNAIVYNTKTVQLLATVGVGNPLGSTNGEYRQVMRYEFEPVGGFSGKYFLCLRDPLEIERQRRTVSPTSRCEIRKRRSSATTRPRCPQPAIPIRGCCTSAISI